MKGEEERVDEGRGSRTRRVRRREEGRGVNVRLRGAGRAGEKEEDSGGDLCHAGSVGLLSSLSSSAGFLLGRREEVLALRLELFDAMCVGMSCNSGPLRVVIASRRIEWRRRSWEDMNDALLLSPVHRVMSMQSRDWLRRERRWRREGRGSGCV